VLQIGTPQEVYHRPTDTFVATFVGSPPMNIVEGGGSVLGFRPESFLPVEAADGGGSLRQFAFAVSLVEDLGADRLVYGRLPEPFQERSVIARLPPTIRVPVEAGRTYTFAIPDTGLLRFDPATGRRVSGGSVHG
jgi:multiple sugar transport system ATP-binding protein